MPDWRFEKISTLSLKALEKSFGRDGVRTNSPPFGLMLLRLTTSLPAASRRRHLNGVLPNAVAAQQNVIHVVEREKCSDSGRRSRQLIARQVAALCHHPTPIRAPAQRRVLRGLGDLVTVVADRHFCLSRQEL